MVPLSTACRPGPPAPSTTEGVDGADHETDIQARRIGDQVGALLGQGPGYTTGRSARIISLALGFPFEDRVGERRNMRVDAAQIAHNAEKIAIVD